MTENDIPGVLVDLGAALRATLAWNHPDGLAAGNASLAPLARNLGEVSLDDAVGECSRSVDLRALCALGGCLQVEKCPHSARACLLKKDPCRRNHGQRRGWEVARRLDGKGFGRGFCCTS